MPIDILLKDAPNLWYYKGTVATVNDIPATALLGDIFRALDNQHLYVVLPANEGGIIDLTASGGGTGTEVDPVYTADKPSIAMVYHVDGQDTVRSLADVVTGDDLSNVTITFNMRSGVQAADLPEIMFSNGYKIHATSTAWGMCNVVGTMMNTWVNITTGAVTPTTYHFASDFGVTDASGNKVNNFTKSIQYTVTGQDIDADCEYNFLNKVNNPDFLEHRQTDMFRWQDTYDYQWETIISIANAKGMTIDESSAVNIKSYNTYNNQYTITNDLGGVITVGFDNANGSAGLIYKNNYQLYSSEGLMDGVGIEKYFEVVNGDRIYSNGVQTITFTPYNADPTTQIQQMLANDTANNAVLADLQNQINDLQASIDNKTIANVTPIDITNTTYTVNNALGARLTGQGDKVLGLLGITVASTGILTVNGTQVYNNTALLSGDAKIYSANVPDLTVITSTGMAYVDIYNYVQGTITAR